MLRVWREPAVLITIQTARTPDPDCAGAIFVDRINLCPGQTLLSAVVRHHLFTQAVQTIVQRAQPEIAFAVAIHRKKLAVSGGEPTQACGRQVSDKLALLCLKVGEPKAAIGAAG